MIFLKNLFVNFTVADSDIPTVVAILQRHKMDPIAVVDEMLLPHDDHIKNRYKKDFESYTAFTKTLNCWINHVESPTFEELARILLPLNRGCAGKCISIIFAS